MPTKQTAGVKTLTNVLLALSEHGSISVAELGERYGVPRSSAFAVIKKMERAGLVTRHGDGRLHLGIEAIHLGYARGRVARLAGPAEAALIWLRERTGVDAVLYSPKLGQIIASTTQTRTIDENELVFPVRDGTGQVVAELKTFNSGPEQSAQLGALKHNCTQVVLTLEHHLTTGGD